jgi:cyclic beta-1,2-glucan synthetase
METLTLHPLAGHEASRRDRILRAAPSFEELTNPNWDPLSGITGPEAWLEQLAREVSEARARAAQTISAFRTLAAKATQFASEINMRFLYDSRRRLFGVGYALGNPVEFTSHYDLLASECRLASLAAIAKGEVPRDHWVALGRPRAASGGPILLSWTGTMFEYLMPLLYMRSFEGSLLDRACEDAVEIQIAYGEREQLPWGVSECAYSALDANQIYQYSAFGVPDLALKRETEATPVVAPYATMLALQVNPIAAIENLKRLEKARLKGPMGFYESIDFSRESKQGESGVTIFTYMAHHQGMSLVALGNVLHEGAMQRRFHSQLRVRAYESLLFERVPITRASAEQIAQRHVPVHKTIDEEPADRVWKETTLVPRVHLNGNGRYSLMLTNAGSGFSRWNGLDITRWRSDSALDPWGSFIYLRDTESGAAWSATNRPLGGDWGTSAVTFAADHAEYFRRVSGIETRMYVSVAPEDDVEIRRVTVTNRSTRHREIEFTSYMELAMIEHRGDTAHPAFAKMFIETEHVEGALIAHRRKRSPDENEIWTAHALLGAEPTQFETDRAKFLGRGRSSADPVSLTRDLSGATGTVLDPIFSLRCSIRIAPRDRCELAFLTLAASSREKLMEEIAKYRGQGALSRALEMSWTRSQLDQRYLGIRPASTHRFHQLAGHLLYPNPGLRASGSRIARNRLGQAALWSYGISGDLPILCATIADSRDLGQIRELLLAHTYCRMLGFRFDLVLLNQESASYDRPLREQLTRYIDAHASRECTDCPGGIFLRDWNAIPEAHRDAILAAATVVMHASRGSLEQQLAGAPVAALPAALLPTAKPSDEADTGLGPMNYIVRDELGGFTADEYVIDKTGGAQTPAPWINVIANENFGTMVTDAGLGFTWNKNSQTNRLTPWHNDPVSDPQSEAIYIRDDETGVVWTMPSGGCRVRHGAGYSIFERNQGGLEQRVTVFVADAKICRLELHNASSRRRALTITYFAEWVLGSVREEQQIRIRTAFDEESGAVTATQSWNGITDEIAFAASEPRPDSWSADRTAFFGRNGSREKPAALERVTLDRQTGPALDPAAALQIRIDLTPGESKQVAFFLGQAPSLERAREIIRSSRTAKPHRWKNLLGAIQVRTPDPAIDLLLNRWLLYQAMSCRFWARSALYQSSGAFGFRDQLQDCLAFVFSAPEITRRHILTCASRQFREGDVQHWWHPESGLGVRTQCSDDFVWLPYAVTRYIEITGDLSILDEQVAFLEGTPLAENEHERMFAARPSSETATVRDHCRRALEHAAKTGSHGLPLIGTGDWNDGLNRVGIAGRGESVWLGWFLCATLDAFAKLDPQGPWLDRAQQLSRALEASCWDGEWYLRGFFDDGTPLGSHANEEAKIDSIAQSWAVISGRANPERERIAVESADRLLADPANGLVKLFTPPFDHSSPHPGYIMGYPPGVRENGGQYTHGSLWLAMAFARLGNGGRAVELLKLMSPIGRDPEKYVGEPYAAAADIYAAPGKEGRAGWTWYTGSAGWMYRIWLEEVLGFQLRGNLLSIRPAIPADWEGFEISYRFGSSTYQIRVEGGSATDRPIRLIDDGGIHRVIVSGRRESSALSEEPSHAERV